MIICATYENLHRSGKAFHSQFRLRHQCFIERQDYNVSKWNGMEFDQYDTPAAVYVIYVSPDGEAWGSARLTPVSHSSMIKDLWPGLVEHPNKAFQSRTWEGTRFCIKKELPAALRARICKELVIGYIEAGLEIGADQIIGVMPPLIFRRVFINSGCPHTFLGQPMKIPSGETIVGASIEVSQEALAAVRDKCDIPANTPHEYMQPSQNLSFAS